MHGANLWPEEATSLRPAVEAAEGRAVTLRVWREGVGETDFVLVPRQQDLPTADGFEKRWLIGVTAGGGLAEGEGHALRFDEFGEIITDPCFDCSGEGIGQFQFFDSDSKAASTTPSGEVEAAFCVLCLPTSRARHQHSARSCT